MATVRVIVLIAILVSSFLLPAARGVQAETLPSGFQESVVFSGLTNPTNIRFSPDGRIFVSEKSGLIKVFDSPSDTTPTIFADLRTNAHNFWDRGLLGMALDPNFPDDPYVYVLYTHDAAIGSTAPRWGTAGTTSDGCPNPPGATTDGCLASGRLSRLQANGNVMTGTEQVLIEDWCQQFPSHSVGDLVFGEDGALYISAGDGASFNNVDYGQYGASNSGFQRNPCGDPPGGVGGSMTSPTAQGGALRAQSLQRAPGSPVNLNGTLLRVDPATGLGLPDNPLAGHANVNARRILAYGMRNPFRITSRPGTNEIWIGDVGWSTWEEVNRITDTTDGLVRNFGWPCYEGNNRQSAYDGANLNICENLYSTGAGAVTAPYYSYNYNAKVVSTDSCPTGSVSIAGLAFQADSGSPYPAEYDNALFFADYSRDCIWVMFPGVGGDPNPGDIRPFVEQAANPVDLEIGLDGNLYYVDFDGGTIRRIEYFGDNEPPIAAATANPTNGNAPLLVSFDGSGSSDPDAGDTISFAWDLDGDGAYDDATSPQPSQTYPAGTHTVRLQVTDNHGASDISDPITISSGNTPPTVSINSPANNTRWKVGDLISFSGSANDAQDGTLPASAFSWSLIIHHCPSNCHTHPIQTFSGVTSGSFTAPDHEYPSHLELQLTVTDSGGLSTTISRTLDPRTVTLTLKSKPPGLQVSFNSINRTTPFQTTVIVGSSNTVTGVTPQTSGAGTYYFQSWSDGGAQTHSILAPSSPAAYTATFSTTSAGFPLAAQRDDFNRADGSIGGNWSGFPSAFTVLNGELDVTASGWDSYILWNPASFGANQEAYIKLQQLDTADGNEHALVLKSQSSTSPLDGSLQVLYSHGSSTIQVWTYEPVAGWVQHGENIAESFAAGDQFGARAKSDGTVEVYKNGTLIGARSISSWPFYGSGGYLGLWMINASQTRLDDFGGGNFVLGPLPAAFRKIAPGNNYRKQPTSPILKWSSSKTSSSYEYCIDTVDNDSCDSAWTSVTTTSASLSGLLNDTVYYWQVRATNASGSVEANGGAWWNFKVQYSSPTLTLPDPDEQTLTLRPQFDWEDDTAGGVSGYTIQVSKNTSFTQLLLSANVGQSFYVPTVNLPKNATLYWRVRTRGSNGPSSYSPYRAFTTPVNPPPTPVLLLPASNALLHDYTVTFTWRSVTGAHNYIIEVDDNSNFSSPEIQENSSMTPSFTVSSDLSENVRFYWRVRTENAAGEMSNWSVPRNFRTAVPPPVLLSPADASTGAERRPDLIWENVLGNKGYVVQVWKAGQKPVLIKSVTLTKDVTQYHLNIELLPSTGYYWRVRTLGANGPSLWSEDFHFETEP